MVNDAVAARKRPTDGAIWGCRHKVQGISCRAVNSVHGDTLEAVTREVCYFWRSHGPSIKESAITICPRRHLAEKIDPL